MATYHRYTTGEEELIRNCWGVYSAEEIAQEIGVSTTALLGHVYRMQPPLPKQTLHDRSWMRWLPHEIAALRLMSTYGATVEDMSNALQRSVVSIKRIMKRERINNEH